ncbi:MAG TPA: DUF5343 domain-containing protein [Terracidiphilus sp.]|nr:DUF5343 domain-containing protein [Terracidiphilus sp.]
MPESEVKKKSYPMLPISHWWALRRKFRQSIPGVVSDTYLATVLSMGTQSARANVLPFLETLGIIDHDGKPTERAKLWRDDEKYSEVCKAILKEVYPEELKSAVPDPGLEKEKAKSWLAHQTGVGGAAASRMVALYSVLVEADASKQPDLDKKRAAKKTPSKAASAGTAKSNLAQPPAAASKPASDLQKDHAGDSSKSRALTHIPEVNINLQIHISADASPDQIEQIFASMSKHLYRHG